VSGGKASRPVLDAAIARIARGEAEGVIVSQIDRLSRMQMSTALKVIERVESAGGQVVAVAENVDPTTPEGRMARNMFLSLAAMQRERNAEAIAQAKERAVRLGIWPTNTVPRGYRKGEGRRLEPDDPSGSIRRAFQARAHGASWREVGRVLEVGPSSASKIVSNRVYLGEIRVGDWHNPAAHPPLVERELWEAAQIQHPAPLHTGAGDWLLKGLVRCGGCQRTMSATEHAYRCLGRAPCGVRARVKYRSLDRFAVGLLLERAGNVAAKPREPEGPDLKARVHAAESELLAFQRAAEAAGDVDLFTEGLRQRADAVRTARAELAGAYRGEDFAPIHLAGVWDDLSVDERRHVLRGFLGVVWVWKERVRFIARGYEPDGLSLPGRKGPEAAPLDDAPLEGEVGVAGLEDLR
jgi:DNA invertase Pin-like site-specific DNA recombinase